MGESQNNSKRTKTIIMETLYRKVLCSERLPTISDMYIVGFGTVVTQQRWYPIITHWIVGQYDIEYWLESLTVEQQTQEGEELEVMLSVDFWAGFLYDMKDNYKYGELVATQIESFMSKFHPPDNSKEVSEEEIDNLIEWPCQQLLGGTGSAIYMNAYDMCKHELCHPRNKD